jgi:hypothetical protein
MRRGLVRATASLLACAAALVGCARPHAGVTVPGAVAATDAMACPRADLPAYAHNDYRNARPLADALALGFRGAEADVFLVRGTLRVGHDVREARRSGTLDSLYLRPLAALAARCGALTADGRPFLLTVEVKARSREAHDSLRALLERRHDALAGTGRVPAVEVVLVGWHPPAREIAADVGRLFGVQRAIASPELGAPAADSSVRLLSLDWSETLGRGRTSAAERRRWLDAIAEARRTRPHALVRVHDLPRDDEVYATLLGAGVELLGVKELNERTAIGVATMRARAAREGRRVVELLPRGSRVRLVAPGAGIARAAVAHVDSVSADSLWIEHATGEPELRALGRLAVPLAAIDRMEVSAGHRSERTAARRGMLAGLAVAIVVPAAILTAQGGLRHADPISWVGAGELAVTAAPALAGMGAVVGALLPRERWPSVVPDRP